MQAFTKLTAAAAPFDQANSDTNQLCPTRFNKVPLGGPEYPRILFHDQRFHPDGSERPDFVLFDLDPSPDVGFRETVQVALLVKSALDALGLVGFPKTSSAWSRRYPEWTTSRS